VKDVRDLYRMDKWNREILDKYCRQFKAGILGFLPSRGEGTPERNETLPDIVHRTTAPFRYQVSRRQTAKVVTKNWGGGDTSINCRAWPKKDSTLGLPLWLSLAPLLQELPRLTESWLHAIPSSVASPSGPTATPSKNHGHLETCHGHQIVHHCHIHSHIYGFLSCHFLRFSKHIRLLLVSLA